MSDRADVVIVGAGVIGVTTALSLARAGRSVIALDRGEPCAEASRAAAGMLAPQIEAHGGDALLRLGLASRDAYARLAAAWAATGRDVGLRQDGITRIAFSDEEAASLHAQAHAQRAIGLNSSWLEPAELRRRHPHVGAEARGALFAPGDGCVDIGAVCDALLDDARAAGVDFRRGEVVEVTTRHGRVNGVRTELDALTAGTVVLAAGAWSGAIVGAPRGAPVVPVRGQMAAVPWPEGVAQAVLFGSAGYVVPRGKEALLGSTMEYAGFVNETTEAGLAHIRRQATAILPMLDDVPFTRTWSGLRPMSPDGLPILGPDPDLGGLIFATGHGRNGILLAPLTGTIIRDLVVRGQTDWDLAPYSITRFQ